MFAFESLCLEYIIFIVCINTNVVFTEQKSANYEFLLYTFMARIRSQKILAPPGEENDPAITHGETTADSTLCIHLQCRTTATFQVGVLGRKTGFPLNTV